MSGSPKTMGRKLVDRAQKARGRTPFKFEFEVIPFFAGELPVGLKKVAFCWERGSKAFHTSAEPVNPHTRAVFWTQFLRQQATVYTEGGRFMPKEYSFKIQAVKGEGADPERKTLAKVRVDLAAFCSPDDPTPVPQEVFFQLKPYGKLKVSIKAAWLKDAKVDLDGLTEASFTTEGDRLARATEDEDEQDLSGFDEGSGGHHQHHGSGGAHSPQHSAGSRSGGPTGAAAQAKHAFALEAAGGHHQGAGSPRIPAAGPKLPGMIPGGFSVPLTPEQEAQQVAEQKAAAEALRQQEMSAMRATLEEQLRAELADQLEAQRGSGWRAVFCCCMPGKQVRIRTGAEPTGGQGGADDGRGLLAAAAAGDAQ